MNLTASSCVLAPSGMGIAWNGWFGTETFAVAPSASSILNGPFTANSS